MKAFGAGEYPNIDLVIYENVWLQRTQSHFPAAHALVDYRRALAKDVLMFIHCGTAFLGT
jgi:hypothetical protein